jgi:hypothetical protein
LIIFGRGVGLGLLLLLESNWKQQEDGYLPRSPRAAERERQCRSPLGWFHLKERKKREG